MTRGALRTLVAAGILLGIGIIGGVLCLGLGITGCTYSPPPDVPLKEFTSRDPIATTVVPMLDAPLPKGKNVIWCASFQLAWDHLAQDVIKAPIELKDAVELSRQFNAATMPVGELPKDSYYAVAGKADKELADTIRREVAQRFSGRQVQSDLPEDPTSFLAFALLKANVKFAHPYFDSKMGIDFKDSNGGVAHVSGFGLLQDGSAQTNETLAAQVDVLYRKTEQNGYRPATEFAIDLDRTSQPSQIILAKVAPQATLGQTVQYVQDCIRNQKDKGDLKLDPDGTLAVPNMNLRIGHHFAEIEGRFLTNPGWREWFVGRALEIVEFRLDKSGADLAAESTIMLQKGSISDQYIFDGPFLVLMQRRGSTRPFLAIWVDNAELLAQP